MSILYNTTQFEDKCTSKS